MVDGSSSLQQRIDALYREGEREIAEAARSSGGERDEHRMRAERLADEAWSLEEQENLAPRASGLWTPRGGDTA